MAKSSPAMLLEMDFIVELVWCGRLLRLMALQKMVEVGVVNMLRWGCVL